MENSNNKKSQKIKKEGTVIETLPSLQFKVKLDEGKEIIAHLAGRLRLYRIKILAGDRVTVEIGPYDEKRGIITFRGNKNR